ncbi:MAG: hypothetical protein Q8N90_02610 [bacterium]|nr:hypothetical protein [bacterium]
MRKLTIPLLAIIALSLLAGSCTSTEAELVKSEISIPQISSSIGGNPNNFAEQHCSYRVTLQNNGVTDVTVRSIEPILSEAFAAKAKGKDFKVTVDTTVAPKTFVEISGEIQFDATGMTKEQIAAMPFFKGIKINTDKVLPIPGQSAK